MGVIQFKGGTIQFKGGTIQFKNLGKVANPTVEALYGLSEMGNQYLAQQVEVTNTDTETVSVYASKSTPPTTSQGYLAGGATTTITIDTIPALPDGEVSFTAYVQMKATGRIDSDIISDEYINPNQITNPTVEALWRYDVMSGDYFKSVEVTNNYAGTVSVYAGLTNNDLQLQPGTLAAEASFTYDLSGPQTYQQSQYPFIAYVQLRATGKIDSEVISDETDI